MTVLDFNLTKELQVLLEEHGGCSFQDFNLLKC